MVQRLLKGGHRVVTYDRDPDAVAEAVSQAAAGTSSMGGAGRPAGPTPGGLGDGARGKTH